MAPRASRPTTSDFSSGAECSGVPFACALVHGALMRRWLTCKVADGRSVAGAEGGGVILTAFASREQHCDKQLRERLDGCVALPRILPRLILS